ncbi:iron-containing redox enzyme family protein [Rhizobium laguerreae]|uniref:iron-containing redox enzyme family protein n=1 Tax=Rhizobium laguerreae TaxID=1076926 RepID=UPI001C923EA9|nr:iron-containing redox enzyme family protein [Rhizobium laguerreae]MBY3220944.1 DUF3865 domain-containing protein [Rhizobium laguerreae]
MNVSPIRSKSLRKIPSKVDLFFLSNPPVYQSLKRVISRELTITGDTLVDEFFTPMISWIYSEIEREVNAHAASAHRAEFMIKELSTFARVNSQFLKRASHSVEGFCPEFAHELMRNFLEEGGDRGNLPAHYVLYSGALIKDLDLFVNGYVPQAASSRLLLWMHDIVVTSHCPSTILGGYYATEAVATAETEELRRLTDRVGQLKAGKTGADLPNLDYYYRLHLDDTHEAATLGMAVEEGHQEGIASFIRNADRYGFLMPQIVDGFLQLVGPLVDQWTELCMLTDSEESSELLWQE